MDVRMDFDARDVQYRLDGFADSLRPDLMKILEKTKNEILRDTKLLVPVDTGELKAEIKGFIYTDSMSVVISAHDNTEAQRLKALVVERGRWPSSPSGAMEGSWYLWDAHKANRRRFYNRVKRMVSAKARDLMKVSGLGRK